MKSPGFYNYDLYARWALSRVAMEGWHDRHLDDITSLLNQDSLPHDPSGTPSVEQLPLSYTKTVR